LISRSSTEAVAALLISSETINPTNDGAPLGIEVKGEMLGINVGAAVTNFSSTM
jgi:hypothetical protein